MLTTTKIFVYKLRPTNEEEEMKRWKIRWYVFIESYKFMQENEMNLGFYGIVDVRLYLWVCVDVTCVLFWIKWKSYVIIECSRLHESKYLCTSLLIGLQQ